VFVRTVQLRDLLGDLVDGALFKEMFSGGTDDIVLD